MTRAVTILHVDGTDRSRDRLERTLRERDDRFKTVGAATIAAASDHLDDGGVDGVVSEWDLPDGDGLELLERVNQREGVPFVVFTDSGSEAIASDALDAGATDYRSKGPGARAGLARDLQERVLDGDSGRESSRQDLVRAHERELARERERFSDLFENFPEPTIAYGLDDDGETRFRAANDAFEESFEFDEAAVLGERVNERIVPEGQRDESRQIDQQVEQGGLIDREVRRLTATGSRIFNLRNIPVTASGEIDGFAVYTDITERKLREQDLQRYETIVETIPMGILVIDDEGQVVNANRPAAEVVGLSLEELIDEPFRTIVERGIVSESTVAAYRRTIQELLASTTDRETDVMDIEVTRVDGETRHLEVYTALLPHDERFQGSVQVYHDITDRVERERELRRQNERLAEFASIVSHDLRNPLNIAKGHLALVRGEVDDEQLDTVAGALERMETLIEETLELARQGETVTETEPLDLGELADGCWEMVATGEATIDVPEETVVHGDRERVKRLLENLFRNSVEHGSTSSRTQSDDAVERADGTVTVTVGELDDGFFVADDGPGIPEDDRDTIFQPGHTTSDDGTGLGLTIVNRIVEAHGWQIQVTDSDTGGARFEITGIDHRTGPEPGRTDDTGRREP